MISFVFFAQVPFLTEGSDIVGRRNIRQRGHSELSGDYVIEDIEEDGEQYRRLIFLNNPTLVQSRAKLMKGWMFYHFLSISNCCF